MCGTAAAASSRSTVMRTISEPARCQRRDLLDGAVDIGRVGVGHRLHHDRCAAADLHIADVNRNGWCAARWGLRTGSSWNLLLRSARECQTGGLQSI